MAYYLSYRVNVFINLALAAFIGFIHVPVPEICNDILYYLVKRVNRLVENGEPNSSGIHSGIQPDGEDTCSVVAQNEQGDGQDGPVSEDESGGAGELEPDGEEDD